MNVLRRLAVAVVCVVLPASIAVAATGDVETDSFVLVSPSERIYDSRPTTLTGGQVVAVHTGRSDAVAAVVTITSTQAAEAGYLVAWDGQSPMPATSAGNFSPGDDEAIQTVVPVVDGSFAVYSSGSVAVLIDLVGYYTGTDVEPPSTTTTTTPSTTTTIPPTAPPTTTIPAGHGDVYIDTSKIPAPQAGYSGIRLIPGANGDPDPYTGAMRTECIFSHMAFDDPIVYPGQSGRSHLHAFYGNTQAYAAMTTTANGATSTCAGAQGNNSAYWVPAMIDTNDGTPIVSNYLQVYYKTGYHGVTPAMVQPFPAGLRMISGSASATSPQDGAVVWYSCSSTGTQTPHIPNCTPGDTMIMAIRFPQCWDGVNLDSPNHKAHMSWPLGWPDLGCPTSHPVALPEIVQHFWYPVPAGGTSSWRLSSDTYAGPAGYSAHADWWNGWDHTVMTGWVNRCMKTPLNCHVNLLGDGTQLRYPSD